MKFKYFSFLSFFLILLLFCASIVRISDIKQKPNEFHDKYVTLIGYVDEVITLPVLGIGVYQLDDGTDKIWVKPHSKIPEKGNRVQVSGEIKVGLTISGRSFGLILIEKEKSQN